MVNPMKLAELERELTHEEYLAMSRRDWLLYQARRDAIRDEQCFLIDSRIAYIEHFAKGYVEGFTEGYIMYDGKKDHEGKIPLPIQVTKNGFRSLPKALQSWLIGLPREQLLDALPCLFRSQSAEAFLKDQKKSNLALKSSKRSRKLLEVKGGAGR